MALDPDGLERLVLAVEDILRRIGFPIAGITGLVYAAITNNVDALLVAAYAGLLGYGGLPWVKDAVNRREEK